MSAQQSSTENKKHSVALDTRLQGRWLLLARGLWLILVILTLAIFFASLPVYIDASAHSVCWVGMRLSATHP